MSRPAAMRPARMRPGVKNPGSRPRASRRETYKAKKNPQYAVCLIGFNGLIPTKFGDNRGGYPVAVVTTKKPRESHKNYDRGQPYHKVVVLEYCRVDNDESAKRLKAALDRCLVGRAAGQHNDPTRGLWRDVRGCFEPHDGESRHMWWIALLVAAEMEVSKSIRGFRSYDARESGSVDDILGALG